MLSTQSLVSSVLSLTVNNLTTTYCNRHTALNHTDPQLGPTPHGGRSHTLQQCVMLFVKQRIISFDV